MPQYSFTGRELINELRAIAVSMSTNASVHEAQIGQEEDALLNYQQDANASVLALLLSERGRDRGLINRTWTCSVRLRTDAIDTEFFAVADKFTSAGVRLDQVDATERKSILDDALEFNLDLFIDSPSPYGTILTGQERKEPISNSDARVYEAHRIIGEFIRACL